MLYSDSEIYTDTFIRVAEWDIEMMCSSILSSELQI